MAIEINGTTGISGVNGSAGTPALQGTDTNTGISFGTDEVNIVTGGEIQAKVDSSGRVLIGQDDTTGVDAEADDLVVSSTAHTGITVRSGSSHNASVYFADQDAVRQGRIEYNHTSDYMRFNTGGTERLRITSDGTLQLNNSPGIDFSQIQTNASGMTSETLDAYEEGTFTPRLNGYTGSAYANVTNTTSHDPGRYIKVGRRVTVFIHYEYTSMPIGQSRPWYIYDLPFTPKTSTVATGAVHFDNITNAYSLVCLKAANYGTPLFLQARTSNSATNPNLTYSGSSGFLSMSLTYWTDA